MLIGMRPSTSTKLQSQLSEQVSLANLAWWNISVGHFTIYWTSSKQMDRLIAWVLHSLGSSAPSASLYQTELGIFCAFQSSGRLIVSLMYVNHALSICSVPFLMLAGIVDSWKVVWQLVANSSRFCVCCHLVSANKRGDGFSSYKITEKWLNNSLK